VRDLVPESQAYMDLLSFERKLDSTITRKRLDIQEALKRPMKVFYGMIMVYRCWLTRRPRLLFWPDARWRHVLTLELWQALPCSFSQMLERRPMLQYEGCVYTIHIHHVYLTWRWNVHVQLLYTSLAVNVLRLLYSKGKLPNILTPKFS